MSEVMSNFRNKFNTKELIIYESKHWIWSLRPVQSTLGSSILYLKRECSVFSKLKPGEFSDLSRIIYVIEDTLKDIFKYNVINYLMLMMLDKQVHYHVIPRYEKTIIFRGKTWQDFGWPGIPVLSGEKSDDSELLIIKNLIKKHLPHTDDLERRQQL